MIKLECSPSHSWWWNGHNSPMNSRWLQSNLQDVDEKVKEMLMLIEEDADSFAQRAEMYYQKRPELVNLVEEFYRAYRALAERYDHITGEIKQNVPRALQVQYGLSCDSPQIGVVGRYSCSPLRKGQALDVLLKKACQSEEQLQSEVKQDGADDRCEHNENGFSPDEGLSSSSDSDVDSSTAAHKLQEEIWDLKEQNRLLIDDHKRTLEVNSTMQLRIGKLQEDHAIFQKEIVNKVNELNRDLSILQNENAKQVHDLLAENIFAKEFKVACHYLQENCDAVEDKISGVKCANDFNKDINEVTCDGSKLGESVVKEKFRILEDRVLKLTKDNKCLGAALQARVDTQRTAKTALRFLRAGVFGLVQKNKKLKEGFSAKLEDETQNKVTKELSRLEEENVKVKNELQNLHGTEEQRISALEQKIKDLHGQIGNMVEENRKLTLVILDRGEEKREAIRQLCFSIDVLKSENQRLELVLGSKKKKSSSSHNTASNCNVPIWRKVFLDVWRGSRAHPCTLAL